MKLQALAPVFFLANAVAAGAQPPAAPLALRPSAHETLAFSAAANGKQLYVCTLSKHETTRFEWVLVGPQAELTDERGRHFGRHVEGPQWLADDGSTIVGTVKASADAPTSDALPWLLLSTRSIGATGRLSDVTSVQRLNTQGGQAPDAIGCTEQAEGDTMGVDYRAQYHFYRNPANGQKPRR
jgi:Protein of unknown function (DUF3455)